MKYPPVLLHGLSDSMIYTSFSQLNTHPCRRFVYDISLIASPISASMQTERFSICSGQKASP